MIFNDNYDKSLFKIINSDKDNRERLLGFISNIPRDFLKVIQGELEKDNIFRYEYLGSDKNIYTCNKGDDNILYISKLSNKNGFYFTDILLELKVYNMLDESKYLGTVKYDYKNDNGMFSLECSEFNYYLDKNNIVYIDFNKGKKNRFSLKKRKK